jgi:hypothetical protein
MRADKRAAAKRTTKPRPQENTIFNAVDIFNFLAVFKTGCVQHKENCFFFFTRKLASAGCFHSDLPNIKRSSRLKWSTEVKGIYGLYSAEFSTRSSCSGIAGFWTVFIVWHSKKTQRFGNLICFLPQVSPTHHLRTKIFPKYCVVLCL